MTELNSELLPVLPLDDVVVLPHMTVTLALADDAQRAAVEAAGRGNRLVVLVPRVEGRFARMGTVARLESSGRLPTGADVAIFKGERRGRPGGGQADIDGALWVQVEPIEEPEGSDRVRELAREYRALLENVLESRGAPGAVQFVRNARTPSHLADLAGYSPELSVDQKIEVLETVDVEQRLTRLIEWTKQNLADASLKEQIRSEVTEGMEKTQREFLLRQQMEAIRKQLGEGSGDVVSGYRRRVEEAGMPEGVRTEVERELDRLERTSEQNPEYGWIRTYLDWMLELPWNVRSEDNYDLHEARRILDEDHTGLDDVKDRILEFLAVRKLREERGLEVIGGRGSGAIITLVGPPGVGKTSLGESVARALGRKFARVSLGGVHDEAEIRGHRRTYIGALPGRIVRALKEAGTKNPVIMLDEIDKVGADFRGDPSAALLEVLDPEQNREFSDHYLEVPYDLSQVLFITTANVAETIGPALRDRMELIRITGYTEAEKLGIAERHLVPRQMDQHGLESSEMEITGDALLGMIRGYTHEAGVRQLERTIAQVCRKVPRKLVESGSTDVVVVRPEDLEEYLGPQRFDFGEAEEEDQVGAVTGVVVSEVGGDIVTVEALAIEGKNELLLTGQLGNVMEESARAALSWSRVNAHRYGARKGFFDNHGLHIHVPAGAIPKDGPSAGVTMVTAMVSAASGRKVDRRVAMTGEVTLRGRVLPIGGVKDKLLAAHRAGLAVFLLPSRNERDLREVDREILDRIEVVPVDTVDQVLERALLPLEERRHGADRRAGFIVGDDAEPRAPGLTAVP